MGITSYNTLEIITRILLEVFTGRLCGMQHIPPDAHNFISGP